jgi:hypothetical protein
VMLQNVVIPVCSRERLVHISPSDARTMLTRALLMGDRKAAANHASCSPISAMDSAMPLTSTVNCGPRVFHLTDHLPRHE